MRYVIFVAPSLCLVDLPQGLLWGWASGLFIGVVYWTWLVTAAHPISLFQNKFSYYAWVIGLAAWGILLHFVWRQSKSLGTRNQLIAVVSAVGIEPTT